MQKVGRASLAGYLLLTATGCGGTTKSEPGGTGGSEEGGSGGMAAGAGGMATGSGGMATGSGGKATGSGGKATGSGGKATGSGGKATGSGGKATGSGGKAGSGGTGGAPDSCTASTDCQWGEIDHEILSADACPCLYGCPGYPLSKATVERRQAQYDALCTPGRDGKGQPCGIDDCIVPPPLSCISQKCVSVR